MQKAEATLATVTPIRGTYTFIIGDYEVHTRSLKWYVKNIKTGQEYPVVGNKGVAVEAAKALDEYDRAAK